MNNKGAYQRARMCVCLCYILWLVWQLNFSHTMRGSRKFCQSKSTFGNFFCCCCCCWGRERGTNQIPLFAGHLGPASETPFKCRWWPNIKCWLSSFVIFRGPEPVLLRNPVFCDFSWGGGQDAESPLDPPIHTHVQYAS